MMRQQKVTVVWLFDESGSLTDDRKEIRENYLRVLDELKVASTKDEELRKGSEQLLTVVASYGQGIHEHTPRPTADLEMIKAAIDKVPVDESGQENMCQSIAAIINKYKQTAIRGKRKLAVIVVSDESGDDGDFVENAISESRAAKAPLYFLGRESMFGYPVRASALDRRTDKRRILDSHPPWSGNSIPRMPAVERTPFTLGYTVCGLRSVRTSPDGSGIGRHFLRSSRRRKYAHRRRRE